MSAGTGGRLVGAALRCYPARWRRLHADEAAEVAALLIRDGTPAASIAWSYLVGAARERLVPRPGRPLSAVAAALLAVACALGFSAALIAGTGPARAASRAQSRSVPSSPSARTEPASARPGDHPASCPVPAVGQPRPDVRRTSHACSR